MQTLYFLNGLGNECERVIQRSVPENNQAVCKWNITTAWMNWLCIKIYWWQWTNAALHFPPPGEPAPFDPTFNGPIKKRWISQLTCGLFLCELWVFFNWVFVDTLRVRQNDFYACSACSFKPITVSLVFTRGCTDIICCVLFMAVILGYIAVGILGERNVRPTQTSESATNSILVIVSSSSMAPFQLFSYYFYNSYYNVCPLNHWLSCHSHHKGGIPITGFLWPHTLARCGVILNISFDSLLKSCQFYILTIECVNTNVRIQQGAHYCYVIEFIPTQWVNIVISSEQRVLISVITLLCQCFRILWIISPSGWLGSCWRIKGLFHSPFSIVQEFNLCYMCMFH